MLNILSEVGISPCDMRDGQIGVIVSWGRNDYLGRIVQRYKNTLIVLGMHADNGWPDICTYDFKKKYPDCLVKPLEDGTKLEVSNNNLYKN